MVREAIQKTLDYVDNNVKEDITAEELAEIAEEEGKLATAVASLKVEPG